MFALDSLCSHYAGIFLEKDSCYGCITNIQSCICSGLKKKKIPKLNLAGPASAWVVQLKKNSLAIVPGKKHQCVVVLWLKVQNLPAIVFKNAEIHNLKRNTEGAG